jgi:hypothetical protein
MTKPPGPGGRYSRYAEPPHRPGTSRASRWTNPNSTGRSRNPGHWEGDSGRRGKGVIMARPYSPPARSPSIRPAVLAVGKIRTLQVEIAKLETIVAGQRADLEIFCYAKEPRLESIFGSLSRKPTSALSNCNRKELKNLA